MVFSQNSVKRWFAGFILAILALIGVVPSALAQVVTSSVRSNDIEYSVRQGDTRSDIARRFCSDYRSIVRENHILDPHWIYAGRTVLHIKNGCNSNAPSVLEKQIVSPRELAGNSRASSGKHISDSEAHKLPRIRLARKTHRFMVADLALIERTSVASCQMAGNQTKRWVSRISDIAACIRHLHGTHIKEAASRYELSENLIIAVMIKESEGNPNAVSSSRCLGLMQLLPSTARGYGIDLAQIFDPRTNILGGARVLRDYGAEVNLNRALASYNLGPGAVRQRMQRQNFNPATFDYVVKVRKILSLLEG